MIRFLVFGLALALSPQTFAAAQMVYVNGAPYVDFGDGRIAVVSHAMGKLNHGTIALRQIENTCDPGQVLANCKIHMEFASHTVGLRWSTHPDANKLNAYVKRIFTGSPNSYDIKDGFGIYSWFSSQVRNQWTASFNPDVIECDQYDWMKQLPANGHRRFLQSWTGETMSPNPETGVSENQTISGGFNIELEKNAAGTFTVAKIGSAVSGDGVPPYISNSVSTITFLANNNQQCQVAFEVSIEDIIKKVQAPHFYDIDPATEMPVRSPIELQNKFTTINGIRAILLPGANLKEYE